MADCTTATTRVWRTLITWYAEVQRPLPWRDPDTTPWGVLVSEVMCQQTPAERVAPQWQAWMQRWPRPSDLAAAETAEVIRQWGRLGYPRRALRLQEAAAVIARDHGDIPPATFEELLRLPGVGDYTAGAVMAFAHGHRALVLDTNVRRVLARLASGRMSPGPSVTAAERETALAWLPADDGTAARWSAAAMELGATVCRAVKPACEVCPVRQDCAWLAAGQPPADRPARRPQSYVGTDRQARGALLAVMRSHEGPVTRRALEAAWPIDVQRMRALDSLVADGLVEALPRSRWSLPRGNAAISTPAQPVS